MMGDFGIERRSSEVEGRGLRRKIAGLEDRARLSQRDDRLTGFTRGSPRLPREGPVRALFQ